MFKRITRSFPAKLSFYLISTLIILSVISFQFIYYFSNKSIEQHTLQEIQDLAEKTDLKLQVLLKSVEKIPSNIQWIISDYGFPPDSLYGISRRIVSENTEIYGCTIAFEPHYFSQKGDYFAPYSYTHKDSVITTQLDPQFDYLKSYWYYNTKISGKAKWIIPYKSKTDENILISTYAAPIFDKDKKFIGVFAVDLTTDWITDLVNSIDAYENSYTIIVDKNGQYVVSRSHHKNIFNVTAHMNDPKATWLARQLTQGKQGKIIIDDDGVKSYVFYAPLTSVDWYMGIICPYDTLYQSLNRFNRIIIGIFSLAMIILFFVNIQIIKKLSKPLKQLAAYTRTIEDGHFDKPLPEIKSNDEMGELFDSFQYMQQKLAVYIDNLQKTTAANEKIESELRIAHKIQMDMVPKKFPPFPERKEIDLYAVLEPAKQVGGDLYDFFIIEDELYFAIGDVSGKGVPASLLMAVTTSLLRSVSLHHISPVEITKFLNNSIFESNEQDMFVTFFIGKLNLKTGELRYCNAGHTSPIITLPNRETSFFEIQSDFPLGIIKDHKYEEYSYRLCPGSGILLYTDGVTDAENTNGEFYTQERLLQMVRTNNNLTPKEFIDLLMTDIKLHIQGAPHTDDLTMLTVVYGVEWNKKNE